MIPATFLVAVVIGKSFNVNFLNEALPLLPVGAANTVLAALDALLS